jgi:hypothetical protein
MVTKFPLVYSQHDSHHDAVKTFRQIIATVTPKTPHMMQKKSQSSSNGLQALA